LLSLSERVNYPIAARDGAADLILDILSQIRHKARLTGQFTLRSGRVSNTYFDKYQFESDPKLLYAIAIEMTNLVPIGTEVLAGLELGGVPLVTLLSQITNLPAAFLRKTAKSYGTCRYAEGADLRGKNVVLVEDVVSSGGAILDAVASLRRDGMNPTVALCVIDRQTGASESLRSAGIELRSLFGMKQIEEAD
jgi:orotate phosphoribosyltransferase